MVSVFVSHSKYDTELRKFFAEIFTNIGLRAKFMEWHDFERKYAGKEIAEIIRAGWSSGHDTNAVFVLLGENVAIPPTDTPEFTHNWVSFEVGAAASCRKPVWAFEEFGKFIQFPIPYVTDYAQYTLDDHEHLKYFGKIFLEQIVYPNNTKTIVPRQITCPYDNCKAKYRYWSESKAINCPVCRRGMDLN